jgi:predicted Fe-Mo cluster-binding NifX family protein
VNSNLERARIAVATSDGTAVADHLARSAAFVVFEIEQSRAISRTIRSREPGCGNHKSFVEMLEGCDTVICGGIGQGAYDSLAQNGIRPVVAAGTLEIEEAVTRFLAGTLGESGERVCLCH